jgi:hypothetical protein
MLFYYLWVYIGLLSNVRYAIRYRDGGQTSATPESLLSNARYIIRDSDGC